MNTEKRDFDKEAASWDEKPARIKLTNDIAQAISEHVVLTGDMDVLDFGCGTGLLTLRLQPFVHSVTGVDSSPGMLRMLKAKTDAMNLQNVRTLLVDLEKGDTLAGTYDLIVTSMTLHHVRGIGALLDQFYKCTVPSGYLSIADLDTEGGEFHENNDGVFHFGFDRPVLRQAFVDAGFVDVRDTTAGEMVKTDREGNARGFSIFVMTGRK